MLRPKLNLLTPETVARVIDEAFELLWDPGIRVHADAALRLLAEAGAEVNPAARLARIPRGLAERCLASAPSSFELFDWEGRLAVQYAADQVHFDPGSAAIEILDHGAAASRPPTTADCVRFIQLAEGLPQIDAVATSLVCQDVPQAIGDLYRLYLVLRFARKPVITGAFGIDSWHVMRELLETAAGGSEALARRPVAVFDVCPSSPLLWSEITCQNLIDCARARIPAELVSMPLAGATGPVTLIGAVVQHAAECLSGITIHQLAGPGSPIVWGGSPAAFDMRTGTTPMGAIETHMIDLAYSEVGKALKPGGLPTHAYLGMSDAKVVDAQCGLESMSGALLGVLAGINMISGPGMLDFESCFSLEKLALDAEIVGMVQRLRRGIDDSHASLGLEIIRQVGHEGGFLKTLHTRRHFRAEQYIPSPVIDRDVRQTWYDKGALDAAARAHQRALQVIAAYQPKPLDPALLHELEAITLNAAKGEGLERLPVLPA